MALTKSRRKGEIRYYDDEPRRPNKWQMRSAAVPPVYRYRKKIPMWAKVVFTSAWILLTIFMYRLFF